MNPTRNKYYLSNIVFLLCLLTLLVNDHYLKYAFSNWLTGKLSDAVGIIMLPLLLAFIFPKLKTHAVWISAVVFVFWKSPFSQGPIDLYNQFALIGITRVVDRTDLFVLILLPVPYTMISDPDRLSFLKINDVHPSVILMPTMIALMATAPPPTHYYALSNGNVTCYKCHITVPYTQEEIIAKLKSVDIVFDSIAPVSAYALDRVPSLKKENAHVYRLNRLIIDKDTLQKLDFTMRTIKNKRTKIYFNGMHVSRDVSDAKLKGTLAKYYRRILFRDLKRKLKE